MEQNFQPSLYLQVIHERLELLRKQSEESLIVDKLGGYENEKNDEVVEWIYEVEEFTAETEQEISDESLVNDSFWCKNMISRIRKLRAKRGQKFTFQRVSNVCSLREELYCKLRLLINIRCDESLTTEFGLTEDKNHYEGYSQEDTFLNEMKVQLEEKNSEEDSDWYRNKIAETRMYIARHDTLQYENVRSSSSMELHEELECEVRLLISVKTVDLMTVGALLNFYHHDLDQFKKVLQNRIKKVNKFLKKINRQLKEENFDKNSDWYSEKIEETKSFFDVLSQDLGSTISMFTSESKPPPDDESLQLDELVEEGASISAVEQNFNPSLYVQVLREMIDLDLKHKEDYCIADTIGSYQNEKFGEVMDRINEVEKFMDEIKPQVLNKGYPANSIWCHGMLLRIRKIRTKCGANLTFQRVSDLGSSSTNMVPLSLREKLYCGVTSLINVYYALKMVIDSLYHGHSLYNFGHSRINEVEQFLRDIKLHLQGKIPETDSRWYHNKIAETRMLIDKWEPEFSLQSQYVESSSIKLHEELRSEIRLLQNIQCVTSLVISMAIMKVQDHNLQYECVIEVQELVSEVKIFIPGTRLELIEKIHGSDWYQNKIAQSRAFTAKHYSAIPFQPQDVRHTDEKFQIFLSFRGEDTRYSFTRNLYDALQQEGFKVFMDDEGLQSGDSISQVLMGAIENSKLSIIVLSENFADSTWCLEELVKILECKQKKNQLVWPIFYKVEPSDVRHQRNSYGKAMVKQETRFGKNSENVKKWGSSLSQVCDLKAFHYKENSRYEGDFIKDIIKCAKNFRDNI